nr:hypothetical protein [Mycoplasmopsis canis]WQQ12356.1 hypothetical protein RRG48_03145 [Mycoplasmopsis canis]
MISVKKPDLSSNKDFNKIINAQVDEEKIVYKIKRNEFLNSIINKTKMTDEEIFYFAPQLINLVKENSSKEKMIWETVVLRENGKIKFLKKIRNNELTNEYKIKHNIIFQNISKPISTSSFDASHFLENNDHLEIYDYLLEFKNNPLNAHSLFLSGSIESNRSLILSLIANEYAIRDKKVSYIDINNLDDKIKRSLSKGDIDLDFLIEELSNVDILIFDEIGYKQLSLWFLESIFVPILSYRYQNNLKTFFGSYFNFDELHIQLFKKNSSENSFADSPIAKKMIFLINKISEEKAWVVNE